jgi:type VI secretion system protein ImpL
VLPPNAVSGRSYFITGLLRDLIFKEAGLAGIDPASNGASACCAGLGAGAAVLAAVLFGAALATSYVRNQRSVNEVDARSAALARLVQAKRRRTARAGRAADAERGAQAARRL